MIGSDYDPFGYLPVKLIPPVLDQQWLNVLLVCIRLMRLQLTNVWSHTVLDNLFKHNCTILRCQWKGIWLCPKLDYRIVIAHVTFLLGKAILPPHEQNFILIWRNCVLGLFWICKHHKYNYLLFYFSPPHLHFPIFLFLSDGQRGSADGHEVSADTLR